MNNTMVLNEYIQSLTSFHRLKHQVVYHTVLPAGSSIWAKPERPWPKDVRNIKNALGIRNLYQHQAQAIDIIRSGQHVVIATPTSSGKTLVYNLPVIEKILENPEAKALYLFPLKALAQDQLRVFKAMAAHSGGVKPDAVIYDGDTSSWHRKRIREKPPNVILTNPEMLHLSFLPHHSLWAVFLSGLEVVVVDEVHTYRGLLGSHMAQVFRRFQRICALYGSFPTYVFSSATVANPGQLAEQLTGFNVETVMQGGASRGRRHVVFINPLDGPAQTAILLLKAALHRGLRTIVYTQSRKLAELIAIWAGSKSGPYASKISAYRSGFLPEERRAIEARLSSGDLLAVISTSALELGIDIGDLDLCILVGYPGSIMSTWQRGGRVGRGGQDSAMILIAGEDALDQYFMRYPTAFLKMEPEAAVVNPYNSEVMSRHLICAAAELPLKTDEPLMLEKSVKKAVRTLEETGELLRSADGKELYSSRKAPHRYVNLRGTGSRFNIVCSQTGQNKGEIDGFRAFRETHAGAVYLHQGITYLVDDLDLDTQTVKVSESVVDYYTRVRGHKNTEILEVSEEKHVREMRFYSGHLKVTDQVTGYEKKRIRGNTLLNVVSLDLPPQVFETHGLWFNIPIEIQRATESKYFHFLGGIHAIEHAVIGTFPLLVLADRNDLGGIATPFHPQVGSAAIFIYDGIPGGAGLTRQAFARTEALLAFAYNVIRSCPCESGCPSCVHSPKCGSGNRPVDKSSAIFILDRIKTASKPDDMEMAVVHPKDLPTRPRRFKQRLRSPRVSKSRPKSVDQPVATKPKHTAAPPINIQYGVLDIETQRSAQEVGGWHRADRMGISCAVLYDSQQDIFFEFLEDQVPLLIEHLKSLNLIVGFNIQRFDYQVLTGYTDVDFRKFPTLDILAEVYKHLGYRLSLAHLSEVTLHAQKSGDGLQALQWWKEGRIREIVDYCKVDVTITRDLYLYGKKYGYLLFKNRSGNTVRVPVKW
ncbi:DEAD/DEAH box helicase [Desulfobacteraceae bacterium SEEP-SAG9]|nr:DEAD/DEAH box helicase [Desulfobacteraceae bacterium SEEP-SAG9]